MFIKYRMSNKQNYSRLGFVHLTGDIIMKETIISALDNHYCLSKKYITT